MYTMYQAFEGLVVNGITHSRENGEVIRTLSKENADFVVYASSDLPSVENIYFYIIEYEKGDIITIENHWGQKWFTVLGEIRKCDLDNINYYLIKLCENAVRDGQVLPKNLVNLLKEVLPKVFSYMTETNYSEERQIFNTNYSRILKYLNLPLRKCVKREIIEEYLRKLLEYYEVEIFQDCIDTELFDLSKQMLECFKIAKKALAETKNVAKQMVSNRQIQAKDENGGIVTYFFEAEDTPCGKIRVSLSKKTVSGCDIDARMKIFDKQGKMLKCIDFYNFCIEYAGLYDFRI